MDIKKVVGIRNLKDGEYSPDAYIAIDGGKGHRKIKLSQIPSGSASMVVAVTGSTATGFTPNHNFTEVSEAFGKGYGITLYRVEGSVRHYYALSEVEMSGDAVAEFTFTSLVPFDHVTSTSDSDITGTSFFKFNANSLTLAATEFVETAEI